MATKDTDPVVPPTQPRTSQGEAASGLGDASIYSRCPTCNDDPEAAPFCSNGCHAELADSLPNPSTVKGTGKLEAPYTTPIPTLHDGSTGWVYCDNCDAPQPVAGHECATRPPGSEHCADCGQSLWFMGANGVWEREESCDACWNLSLLDDAATRAELAESLLCAMAFDHMRLVLLFYGRCVPPDECAFCSAARGGGR